MTSTKTEVREWLEALMPRVNALNAYRGSDECDESFDLEFRDGDFRYNRQVYCYTSESFEYILKTLKNREQKVERCKEVIRRLNDAQALVKLALMESERYGVRPCHYNQVVEFAKLEW